LGKKQKRRGKHIFCILAGLIIINLAGCASMPPSLLGYEKNDLYEETRVLLGYGDFELAAQRNLKVLESMGYMEPADTAVYNLGLIYAHQENPARDFALAKDYFKKLTGHFPASKFYQDAKAWVGAIELLAEMDVCKEDLLLAIKEKNSCKQNQIMTLKEKNTFELVNNPPQTSSYEPPGLGGFETAIAKKQEQLASGENSEGKDVLLYQLSLLYAHQENPKKDYKKAQMLLKQLVADYPDSPLVDETQIWLGVFDVIEKIQQVDVEIDEKKKEFSQ
jgi:TolA-binding protein